MSNMQRLLNTEEVAKILNLSSGTVESWVFKKLIPYVKLNKAVRFDIETIEKWVRENTVSSQIGSKGN